MEIVPNLENKNPKDEYGRTPLHFAAEYGHLNIVELYNEQLSNVHPKANSNLQNITPIHCAVKTGQSEVVEYLLNFLDEDKNPALSNGMTILHSAAYNGHFKIFQILNCSPQIIFIQQQMSLDLGRRYLR